MQECSAWHIRAAYCVADTDYCIMSGLVAKSFAITIILDKIRIELRENVMKDLTKGKPSKIILYFALPILIGNLFNLAYNLADTRIVGTYLGNDALAAVGSISTLNDLLVGFVVGLANGFAVITAQYFGKGKKETARKIFALSLLIGVIVTAVIVAASLTFMDGMLGWMNVMEEHRTASARYITIIIAGLFFSVLYNVLAGSLRAIGDAYTPLIFLIISAGLNIVLDMLCVKYLAMGVGGAAAATVAAQAVSAALCFIYTWKKYDFLHFRIKDFIPEKCYVKPMLESGLSMGLMSSLVAFGTLSLQTAINKLGTNTIVAHAATRKLTNLYMLPFGVLGTAMATYCGQNYGAGRYDRIKAGLKAALGYSYIWCVLVVIASYTICPYLIIAITDTKIQEVIDTACLYQRVDTLFYLLVPTINILRNSLQGMGDHITPIFSSGLELAGKVVIAAVLTPVVGFWGIIAAEPTVWIVMVIPLIISMVRRMKKAKLMN